MDWKIFTATFSAIFLAELADKTQLVGIAMSSKSGRPLSVWLGSVSAFIVVTAVSVLMGAAFSKFIRPDIIRYLGAALFVIIGILMLAGRL